MGENPKDSFRNGELKPWCGMDICKSEGNYGKTKKPGGNSRE